MFVRRIGGGGPLPRDGGGLTLGPGTTPPGSLRSPTSPMPGTSHPGISEVSARLPYRPRRTSLSCSHSRPRPGAAGSGILDRFQAKPVTVPELPAKEKS